MQDIPWKSIEMIIKHNKQQAIFRKEKYANFIQLERKITASLDMEKDTIKLVNCLNEENR